MRIAYPRPFDIYRQMCYVYRNTVYQCNYRLSQMGCCNLVSHITVHALQHVFLLYTVLDLVASLCAGYACLRAFMY